MYKRELSIIIIIYLGLTYSARIPKLPESLKRCSKNTSPEELNECLRIAIQEAHRTLKNGDPSINVEPIDPLTVPEISIAQSSGPVSIKIIQKNLKITGLSDAKVPEIKIDFDAGQLSGSTYFPKLIQIADQTTDGRILVVPIKGSGKATTTIDGFSSTYKAKFKQYEKNGYNYLKFDEQDLEYSMNIDKMKMNIENLFNGDKSLGDATNKVINDNWKVIFSELQPVYEHTFRKLFINALNRFFTKVPLEEIFLDYNNK